MANERPRDFRERVEVSGLRSRPFKDLYHYLLTISWTHLLTLLALAWLGVNVLFAALFLLDPTGLENGTPHSFRDAFFFSVQTLGTIGYGKLVPRSLYANSLVTAEAFVGLVSTAMAAGLMFAKFSRPTARIVFSRRMVMQPRDGVPSLVLRVANERGNQVVEAQMRLIMLRDESTAEGERIRRMTDLKLARPSSAAFALSWLAFHPITPDSPLYGQTPESLSAVRAEFFVSILGIDETFAQQVHARHNYFSDEIDWNHRFVDIMHAQPNGKMVLDYARFHDTQPLSAPKEQAK